MWGHLRVHIYIYRKLRNIANHRPSSEQQDTTMHGRNFIIKYLCQLRSDRTSAAVNDLRRALELCAYLY